MSHLATAELPALISWDEFQLLGEERLQDGEHYELHDGEVVIVPPPRPRHVGMQLRLPQLLEFVRDQDLMVAQEYWFRPAVNYQFWRADLVIIPRSLSAEMMRWDGWQVYAPPLIIEVLSPSDEKRKDRKTNTPEKISRERIVSMSAGTREFWVIDADKRTVHVTLSEGVKIYGPGELVPCSLTPGSSVAVDAIFES